MKWSQSQAKAPGLGTGIISNPWIKMGYPLLIKRGNWTSYVYIYIVFIWWENRFHCYFRFGKYFKVPRCIGSWFSWFGMPLNLVNAIGPTWWLLVSASVLGTCLSGYNPYLLATATGSWPILTGIFHGIYPSYWALIRQESHFHSTLFAAGSPPLRKSSSRAHPEVVSFCDSLIHQMTEGWDIRKDHRMSDVLTRGNFKWTRCKPAQYSTKFENVWNMLTPVWVVQC